MTARDITSDTELLMPWMPQELIDLYVDSYVEYGDPELAWAAVRQSAAYDRFFPGMTRDDGTMRFGDEQEYIAVTEAYDDVFRSVGLNPSLWKERYIDLLEGDVSPDELMRDRVMPIYERLIDQGSEAIRQRYADDWGLEMTFESILAAALDPDDIGSRILNRQIALSEIGGEAASSGFNVTKEYAERLYEDKNLTREQADLLFQQAETFVPAMSVLSARHADPDDDFNLEDFVSAELFSNPQQRRRMRRLIAQENAAFTGGATIDYLRTREGGVAGLMDR